MSVRKLSTSFAIGGSELPVKTWDVSLGSDGSIATVSATTSLALLRMSDVDVISWSQEADGASIDVFAGYDGDSKHLFSGVLDEFEWEFDEDLIMITGRDYAAVLADTQAITSSIKYKNSSISDIVQQIAEVNGFTADVEQTSLKPSTEFWGGSAYTPNPQTWWSMLQNLAQQLGWELNVTPDKTLHFGPPKSQSTLQLVWAPTPEEVRSRGKIPLKNLCFKYNPRNNSNFEVKVQSYHPQKAEKITASATPSNVLSGVGKKSKNGSTTLVGNTGRRTRGSRSGSKPSKKPVFVYTMDGLDNERAQKKAQAIADDIAKRAVIVSGKIEGNPEIAIHSQIKIAKSTVDLLGFDSLTYKVSRIQQSFTMPQNKTGGWITSFEAMTSIPGG